MSQLHETVEDMLRKGRTKKQIVKGMSKLGYTENEIQEAIDQAGFGERPHMLLEKEEYLNKRRQSLGKDELPVQDSQRPIKEDEKPGWLIPSIIVILLILGGFALANTFGPQIRQQTANTYQKFFAQKDTEFYTYCTENLEGYNKDDRAEICIYLDRKNPEELTYRDMSDACRQISYDQRMVGACALETTTLVDHFIAQANLSQNLSPQR